MKRLTLKQKYRIPYLFIGMIIVSALAVGAGVVIAKQKATLAVSGADFSAGRIIDDSVFYNSSAMTVSQIQSFLNQEVTQCDTNGTTMYSGSTSRASYGAANGAPAPYICLKDYTQSVPSMIHSGSDLCPVSIATSGVKSAAQIIYDVSQSCQINPQVLLVLLEKEQGLVTDTWPWPIQYRSATGYGCPDTAPCDSEYYGFFNQVYQSAQAFKRYAANATNYNYRAGRNNVVLFNPQTSCGSSTVYIENQATAGLYTYTPYQPNQAALDNLYGSGDSCSSYGNRNFWRLFNDWFGSSVVGKQVSPLYKSSSSDTIYMIANGVKYAVASPDILQAYGLLKYSVAIVNDAFLSNYSTGPALNSTIAKKADDSSGTLYMFDDGKRYPIDISACKQFPDGTANTTTSWGLDCFNSNVVLSLPNIVVDRYTTQDSPLPTVVLYDNSAWKIENGTKRRITDPVFIDVLGGWSKTRWMQSINMSMQDGQLLIPANSIVKFSGSDQLYLKTDQKLLPVNSPQDFASWNLSHLTVYSLAASYNATAPLPVGTPISPIAKDVYSHYYLITSDGNKVAIDQSSEQWPSQGATQDVDSYLNILPAQGATGVYRSAAGTIFRVSGGKKYAFPTVDDLKNSPYNKPIIGVTAGAEALLPYGGLSLAPGRLFKVIGGDAIYLVKDGASSLTVTSTKYPGLPYAQLITVDPTTGALYPSTGTYQP